MAKYIYPFIAFCISTALQLSGIQNPTIAYILFVITGILLIWASWSHIKKIGKEGLIIIIVFILIGWIVIYFIYKPKSYDKTFGIVLTPMTDKNGECDEKMNGSIRADGKPLTGCVMRIGVMPNKQEVRGFISFNISKIPKDADIISAKLDLTMQNEPIGDLDPKVFKTIIVETIDIGNKLDETDFNKEGTDTGKENLIDFKYIDKRLHNVTRELNKFMETGRNIVTFRLRFKLPELYNKSNNIDAIGINIEKCQSSLIIEYENKKIL